jgi:hypothetical protein
VHLGTGCASSTDRALENYLKNPTKVDQDTRQWREDLERFARHVPGWNIGGADPNADLKAMGADKYYFANRGSYGVSVTILTDRPIEAFVPKTWRLLDSYGAPATGLGEPWINFIHIQSARYVLATSGRSVRNGGAFCGTEEWEARLFEIPGSRLRRDEPSRQPMIELFRGTARALAEEKVSCSRYYGDRLRGYTSRSFLLDGREIPGELAANEPPTGNPTHKVIVPACPIETVLKPAVPMKEVIRPGFRFPIWSKVPPPRNC